MSTIETPTSVDFAAMTASPAKLRNGSWGCRVYGPCQVGDYVTIETRSGKTWMAELTDCVWTGTDDRTGYPVSLCTTRTSRSRPISGDDRYYDAPEGSGTHYDR